MQRHVKLENAFDDHVKQIERHVTRLEKVFWLLERKPDGKNDEAIEGVTEEAGTIISETREGTMTRDAAFIILAQKIKHYEIATLWKACAGGHGSGSCC